MVGRSWDNYTDRAMQGSCGLGPAKEARPICSRKSTFIKQLQELKYFHQRPSRFGGVFLIEDGVAMSSITPPGESGPFSDVGGKRRGLMAGEATLPPLPFPFMAEQVACMNLVGSWAS